MEYLNNLDIRLRKKLLSFRRFIFIELRLYIRFFSYRVKYELEDFVGYGMFCVAACYLNRSRIMEDISENNPIFELMSNYGVRKYVWILLRLVDRLIIKNIKIKIVNMRLLILIKGSFENVRVLFFCSVFIICLFAFICIITIDTLIIIFKLCLIILFRTFIVLGALVVIFFIACLRLLIKVFM